jgi:hypothetical protein
LDPSNVNRGPFFLIDRAYKYKMAALIGLPTATVKLNAPVPRPTSLAANNAMLAARAIS